jgi:putative transposase
MKKTRFTEEQMVTILREADERPVPEVAKKHSISAQTTYGWRKHFGTLEPADIKRLRQLEHENGRLKAMVADRDLELDVLKEITRKSGRRTCAPAAGRRRRRAWPVEPPCVRLALGGPVDIRLRISAEGARCPGDGCDARLGRSVSALWLSGDPDLPPAGGPCDECGADTSAPAPGGTAGASASATAPDGHRPSPARAGERCQSRVGVRLGVRHVREWTDAEVPHGDRRVDAGIWESMWPVASAPNASSKFWRNW